MITKMIIAVANDNLKLVEKLLRHGAGINDKDKTSLADAALYYAAEHKKWRSVKLLVELGADVNAKDKWGETVLDHAVMNDNFELAQWLKGHGAKE